MNSPKQQEDTNPAILAAAQTCSVPGDVTTNLERHLVLAAEAARRHAELIAFPELSLTGYEPHLANACAFSPADPRINKLRVFSRESGITIIVGAPVRLDGALFIGSFVICSDGACRIYTKHYLHPGEERVFQPGSENVVVKLGNETIAPAICADIAHPAHPEAAANMGATVYVASALITCQGYESDCRLLSTYAKTYSMLTVLANHGAESGGYESAGRSAVWSPSGELLAALPGTGEGLVIAEKRKSAWTAGVGVAA